MHDKLTRKDLELMRKELEERRTVLMPRQLEAVKEARAFGDLSENFEYKAAKQELNKNKGRIRYLENMIRTAVIIDETGGKAGREGGVALYDTVVVYLPEEKETEELKIVTTMRKDPLRGLISNESPVGKALLGRRVGETVHVQVDERYGYDMVINSIEKGSDDGSIPLNTY